MASIYKTARGWRVQIKRRGVRDSRLFESAREAKAWGTVREAEIIEDTGRGPRGNHTLREALRRYANEVSPTKRGGRWERIRLAAFERADLPLDTPLNEITAQHVATFRDARVALVGPASVLRELALLSSVFQMCRRAWKSCEENTRA